MAGHGNGSTQFHGAAGEDGSPAPSGEDWGAAYIHGVEDVFDTENEGLAPADLGEVSDEPAASNEEDGYVPDDELGAGGAGGPLIYYDGADWIEGVPTRDDIVAEHDAWPSAPAGLASAARGIAETIRGHFDAEKPVFFMPSDVEETNEYSNGYPSYVLKLHGAVMDGSKAEVTVTGIDVFFDVRVPDRPPTGARLSAAGKARLAAVGAPGAPTNHVALFDAHLRQVLADAGVAGVRVETVEAFPIRGYHTEKKPYKRVHLPNLQQRKKAIAAARAVGFETASDDRSSYYRKAAREYGLPLADWAVLSGYDYARGPTAQSPLAAHVVRVPVGTYRPLVDVMAPKAKREAAGAVKAKNPLLAKDRTLVLTWDIETHSDRPAGDLPDAQHDGDEAFMVCVTVHWKDDPAPLKQVCLVDTPAAPDPRWTTVVCGTPKNVLKAFALVWRGFAPDIQVGFNDSDYDWPFVVEKARRFKILAWMWNKMSASPRRVLTDDSVLRWNFNRDKRIKISAEESFASSYLKVPGCVPIDARVCYKKLYPKGETPKAGSLKFYLEISGLAGKADMPYTRMWRYYEEARRTFADWKTEPGPFSLAGLVGAADPGAGVQHEALRLAAKVHLEKARPTAARPPGTVLEAEQRVRDAARRTGTPEAAAQACAAAARADAARAAARPVREVGPAEAAEHMRHVAHYCVVDALRCQQLLVRRNVVNDYREVGSLAFVSLFDSHYYAGGMKVCNLLGAYAWRRDVLVSMVPREQEESGKYPGAYVFPPEKGLTPDPDRLAAIDAAAARLRALLAEARLPGERGPGVPSPKDGAPSADLEARISAARAAVAEAFAAFAGDRPVTGLDFASLYPSLIMAYNLSPEKILLTAEEAAYWESQGRKVHKIEFPFNGRTVRGWAVRHNNVPEDIGLFPSVLIDLFNKRAEVKVGWTAHGVVKELIELIFGRAQKAVADAAVRLGAPKDAAEKAAAARRLTAAEISDAVRAVLAEAEGKRAATDAALAPGAPPPPIPPGATLAEEVGELQRQNRLAREQAEGIHRLFKLAAARPGAALPDTAGMPADADLGAAVRDEYDRASFDWTCANSKQYALKVYMNTFYGESGNSLGPFFLLPLAGGVTSAGQYNIKLVADFVRGRGFRIKYGDSVSGDSALVVRRGGAVRTTRIDEVVPEGEWAPYGDKEAAETPGLEVWQDGGFTPVARVIRHACAKPLVRVLTRTGVADCTADHSLLRPDGARARPREVRVGDALLHAEDAGLVRALDSAVLDVVGRDEAFAMGLFAADGSCDVHHGNGGRSTGYAWAINNLDLGLLERAAACLPFPTKILDTIRSSGVYRLVPVGSTKGPTLRYRALFYNAHSEKRVPPEILGAAFDTALGFWTGFCAGAGRRAEQARQASWRIDQEGKEMCTGLWLLGRRLGWEASLNDRADKPSLFRMTFSDAQARKRPLTAVEKMRPLAAVPEFVYDLETGSHHFHVGPGDLVVHNTDSLYLVCPPAVFAECDEAYGAGRMSREEWWSAMVRITMRSVTTIRDEVGALLKADNGTPYLKMAFEEVLYPVDFTGKKKYFGIPHLNEVNFRPKKLFIRGIDVVKQGQPGLAREIGNRIMWACMALDNRRKPRQIVEDVLRDAVVNGEQWKFDHFVKTDAWKPHKNNIPVHRFIARMRARHAAEVAEGERAIAAGRTPKPYLYNLPEPGERFSYVIAKTGAAFDIYGRKSTMKKGDRMEFAKAAKALGLEVDVAFYMISYVVGLCARFINGDAAFAPPAVARLTEKADEFSQKAAKKALENFVKGLNNLDSGTLRRRGYAYRRAYGQAAAAAVDALVERVGHAGAEVLHGRWLDFELFGGEGGDEGDEDAAANPTAATVEGLWRTAGDLADAVLASDGDWWNDALGLALGFKANGADAEGAADGAAPTAKRLYAAGAARGRGARGVAARRPQAGAFEAGLASSLARQEAAVRAELAALAPAVADVALRYEADLARLVHHMRLSEHGARGTEIGAAEAGLEAQAVGADPSCAIFGVTAADRSALVDLRRAWFAAAGIQLTRRRAAAFAAHVARLKDRRLRVAAAPPPAARAKVVAEAAARLQIRGDLGAL